MPGERFDHHAGGGVGAPIPHDDVRGEIARVPTVAQRRLFRTDLGEQIGEGKSFPHEQSLSTAPVDTRSTS